MVLKKKVIQGGRDTEVITRRSRQCGRDMEVVTRRSVPGGHMTK